MTNLDLNLIRLHSCKTWNRKMETEWLQKEIDLNSKHEEIVSRREFLLRQSVDSLDSREVFSSSVASHRVQVQRRNKELLKDIDMCKDGITKNLGKPQSTELVTLKEKYWAMVEEELPAWKSNVKTARKSNPPSAR